MELFEQHGAKRNVYKSNPRKLLNFVKNRDQLSLQKALGPLDSIQPQKLAKTQRGVNREPLLAPGHKASRTTEVKEC
jgi:hypothetical protein